MFSPDRPKSRLPRVLTSTAGLIAVGASALPWYSWETPRTFAGDVRGLSTTEGRITALLGVLLLVLGLFMLVSRGATTRASAPVLVLALSVALTALSLYNVSRQDAKLADAIRQGIEETTGTASPPHVDAVEREFARIGLRLSLGVGVYLAVGSGLLGILAAFAAATRRGQSAHDRAFRGDPWRRPIRFGSRGSGGFSMKSRPRNPSRWGA